MPRLVQIAGLILCATSVWAAWEMRTMLRGTWAWEFRLVLLLALAVVVASVVERGAQALTAWLAHKREKG